jgi:hypothetical protein
MVDDSFAAKYSGAATFQRCTPNGGVALAVRPHQLVLKIFGTIYSEHLITVLKEMRSAGHLQSDDFCALIDLTGFTGNIDWDEVKKIGSVMPEGQSRSNKNAYLVRDTYLAMIAKITAVLFPHTECQAFTNEADARQWLGWE